MSRESFLADMHAALGRAPSAPGGQPGERDLVSYFTTLRNDPERALAAYHDYALSFYIHVADATGDRSADVVWPGGSCDRWSELAVRPRRHQQRIIDCEGYAYLAQELLTAAGWRLRGYQVLYLLPTRTTTFDYHMVAVLEFPDGGRVVYIGTARISDSAVTDAHHVWPDVGFNARYGPIRPTAHDAIDEVQRLVETGPQREIAPMRQRHSVLPPPM